ncbi:hypothetical protein MMC11_005216 [Xylographa trunciseda]|nr:hypothetical protein [Xylographa trunciseda]
MDPSGQQPILQDPFNQSRVDSYVKADRDSGVEEQQLANCKRHHRKSDEPKSISPASAANQGFTHGDSSSSRSKLRRLSSRSTSSSRVHPEDSGGRLRYSQEACLRYARRLSGNIPHMSEVPPDAGFPRPGCVTLGLSNCGDLDGRKADCWKPTAMQHHDPLSIMCVVSPEDTRLRLQI